MKGKKTPLRLKIILLLTTGLCLTANAQVAGFDCSKATTKIEKMICVDDELSRLDEELGAAYKAALMDEKQADVTRQTQKQWLKQRNSCADAGCVQKAYQTRLKEFKSSENQISQKADAPAKPDAKPSLAKKPLWAFCVDVPFQGRGADCYGVVGKGTTVCEKYLKGLNSMTEPVKCKLPVPPGFSEPEWEEMNYMDHLDWAYHIARNHFVGAETYMLMTFEQWKPLFLKEVAAGRLAPEMKKTRVKATGDNIITLLAFTEDKHGCQRPPEETQKRDPIYSVWDGLGYLYSILTEDPDKPLVNIDSGLNSISGTPESVLLLYAGKPYFIRMIDPWNPVIDIVAFRSDPKRVLTIPEKSIYSTTSICDFKLVNHYEYYQQKKIK